nr:hypothetical protein [Candidatus Frankia alpina]
MPLSAHRGRDSSLGEVARDAGQRLARQGPACDLADDRGLGLPNSDEVGFVAERTGAPSIRPARLGGLAALTALTFSLVLGLVPGGGAQDPGHHAPGRGNEVDLPRGRSQLQAKPVREVDNVF